MAFNDAVAILHPAPGDLDVEGAVDGAKLHSLLDHMSGEKVRIEVEGDKLRVRAGRTDASFSLLPVSLPIESVDMSGEMVDLPDGFADKLRWASSSCARDVSRPALTCVNVEDGWIQSSDSYRMSRVSYEGELPRLMIPAPQVAVLVNYPIVRVALSEGGEWARFETKDDTTLAVRSMSGKFPNIAKHYAVEGKRVELPAALREVIERARIFSQRDKVLDEEIKLTMRKSQVVVSAEYEGGKFSETVQCPGAVEGTTFSVHPKFLSSALESATGFVLGDAAAKFASEAKGWEHVVSLKA